jgi:hypothetical protein
MDSRDFKTRFVTAFGEIPKWVDFDPSEFVTFDIHALQQVPLRAADVELLSTIGMPRSSAPMLDFRARHAEEVSDIKVAFEIPREYFPIGHNNYGDHICVGGKSGDVVYFEHGSHRPRKVFINSTLLHFAECICVFQELVTTLRLGDAPGEIKRVDPSAMMPGTMWHTESTRAPPNNSLERTRGR